MVNSHIEWIINLILYNKLLLTMSTKTYSKKYLNLIKYWLINVDQNVVLLIFSSNLPDSSHMMTGMCSRFFVPCWITNNGNMTRCCSHNFAHSTSSVTDNNHGWCFITSILQKRNIRLRHYLCMHIKQRDTS